MTVRGAPAIGAAAAFAMAQAFAEAPATNPWRTPSRRRPNRGDATHRARTLRRRSSTYGPPRNWKRIPSRRSARGGTAFAAEVESCRRVWRARGGADPGRARVLTHSSRWLGRWIRQRAGAHLPAAAQGRTRPRLGRRDAARARRAPASPPGVRRGALARGDRGQRRRLVHEPRRGGPGDRRRRPHAANGDVVTRSPRWAGRVARGSSASPSTSPRRPRPSTPATATAPRYHRGAGGRRVHYQEGPDAGILRRVRVTSPARPRATRPSTDPGPARDRLRHRHRVFTGRRAAAHEAVDQSRPPLPCRFAAVPLPYRRGAEGGPGLPAPCRATTDARCRFGRQATGSYLSPGTGEVDGLIRPERALSRPPRSDRQSAIMSSERRPLRVNLLAT